VLSFFQVFWPTLCKHFSCLPSCYVFRKYHPPWFDHFNNICWRVQIMKLLTLQSSPSFHYIPTHSLFLSLKSEYFPQHPVLKTPLPIYILPLMRETKFHSHTKQEKLHHTYKSFILFSPYRSYLSLNSYSKAFFY
jgi:hypothetical protein